MTKFEIVFTRYDADGEARSGDTEIVEAESAAEARAKFTLTLAPPPSGYVDDIQVAPAP